ncbi:MAG TPA: hypothetical protein VF155_06060 [Candidatus Dormibacteraeota bacterium]
MPDERQNANTSDDGGPGWRVRQPASQPPAWDSGSVTPSTQLPPGHLQPLPSAPPARLVQESQQPATAPRPEPPPGQTLVPGGASRRRTTLIYGLCALVAFGLAGGGAVLLTSGHPVSSGPAAGGTGSQTVGRPSLTAAVQRLESDSMRADMKVTESFGVSGPGGAAFGEFPGDIELTVHIDQQSANRSELSETVAGPGFKETTIAVLYDDTVYVSQDNGASYQTVTVAEADTHQYSPKSPLAFLSMLGDVQPTGDVEVNGVTAASYHATLDPVKVDTFVKTELANEDGAAFDPILNHVGITDGTLDAAVDPNGNLLSETSNVDAAVDLGAFSPDGAGSTLNVHEGFSGAFSDYGSAITITKPALITGPMVLT